MTEKTDFEGPVMRIPLSRCFNWTACKNNDGYGSILVAGKGLKAHRLAYTLFRGPIPEGMCVCHICDFPGCVNPAHLFLGTHAENVKDRNAKGRGNQPGEKNYYPAKISDRSVIEMRTQYAAGGITYQRIADRFGISASHAANIIRNKKRKVLGAA